MDDPAVALIMRTRLLTESSLIIEWLTSEQGRISTVAKGARRQNSAFRGKLDLFFLAEISFRRSSRSELHTLKEVRLLDSHEVFRSNYRKLGQASYAVALIEKLTEKDTPLPEVFILLTSYFKFLKSGAAAARNVFTFELKVLELMGIFPDVEQSRLNKLSRNLMEQLVRIAWKDLEQLEIPPAQSNDLAGFLNRYLEQQIHKVPNSRIDALGL